MKKIVLMITSVAFMLPAYVMAAANVSVSITAQKVIMIEKDGKKVEKLVSASETVPGDTLLYTLTYRNSGDESAKGVVLNDPIPSGTIYLTDSAFGAGSEITFSIDNGKNFKQPSMLRYEVDVAGKAEKRKATPDKYTDIRWTVSEVAPGKSGAGSFRVRVQ